MLTDGAFDESLGTSRTVGYRCGNCAYAAGLVDLPEASFAALEGIAVWMVGTLMAQPHPTHAHVDRAVAWSKRLGVGRTILTHLSHRIDYGVLQETLPDGVEPAYDGMIIDVE